MTKFRKKTVEVLLPKEEETKVVTVHIPLEVWRKLMLMKVDGKVKSLNNAVIDAIHLYVEEKAI